MDFGHVRNFTWACTQLHLQVLGHVQGTIAIHLGMYATSLGHVRNFTWACMQLHLGMYATSLGHVCNFTWACMQLHLGMYATSLGHVCNFTWACMQLHLGMYATSLGHVRNFTWACMQLHPEEALAVHTCNYANRQGTRWSPHAHGGEFVQHHTYVQCRNPVHTKVDVECVIHTS